MTLPGLRREAASTARRCRSGFKGKSIARRARDGRARSARALRERPEDPPTCCRRCTTSGLDYIKLGQPSPTLSGGEAAADQAGPRAGQDEARARRSTSSTSRPPACTSRTSSKLLEVLHGFVEAGQHGRSSIEHNLDVIKTADWVDRPRARGASRRRSGRRRRGRRKPVAACRGSRTPGRHALAKALQAGEGRRQAARKKPSAATTGAKPSRKRRGLDIEVEGPASTTSRASTSSIPARQDDRCASGPSGSGKSSLAMDTIYAEGQRRYVESLSATPDSSSANAEAEGRGASSGLSPAISIEQKNDGESPRSTVGTVTEIYDYLRILFAPGSGQPYCPSARHARSAPRPPTRSSRRSSTSPEGTKLYRDGPARARATARSTRPSGTSCGRSGFSRVRVDGAFGEPGHASQAEPPPQAPRSRWSSTGAGRPAVDPIPLGRLDRVGARPGQGVRP